MSAIRTLLALLVVYCGTASGNEPPNVASPPLPEELTADRPGDDDIQKALKARYRIALEALQGIEAASAAGVGIDVPSPEQAARQHVQVAQAALDLCQTPQQRVAVLKYRLAAWQALERFAKELYRAGQTPSVSYHRILYERLDTEIELLQATRAAKPRTKKEDDTVPLADEARPRTTITHEGQPCPSSGRSR